MLFQPGAPEKSGIETVPTREEDNVRRVAVCEGVELEVIHS
jgi:hypothetical protein